MVGLDLPQNVPVPRGGGDQNESAYNKLYLEK